MENKFMKGINKLGIYMEVLLFVLIILILLGIVLFGFLNGNLFYALGKTTIFWIIIYFWTKRINRLLGNKK